MVIKFLAMKINKNFHKNGDTIRYAERDIESTRGTILKVTRTVSNVATTVVYYDDS